MNIKDIADWWFIEANKWAIYRPLSGGYLQAGALPAPENPQNGDIRGNLGKYGASYQVYFDGTWYDLLWTGSTVVRDLDVYISNRRITYRSDWPLCFAEVTIHEEDSCTSTS
jgi:hypothetical protein